MIPDLLVTLSIQELGIKTSYSGLISSTLFKRMISITSILISVASLWLRIEKCLTSHSNFLYFFNYYLMFGITRVSGYLTPVSMKHFVKLFLWCTVFNIFIGHQKVALRDNQQIETKLSLIELMDVAGGTCVCMVCMGLCYRLSCCAKTEIIKYKPAQNFNLFGKTLILSLLLLLLLYKHLHMYICIYILVAGGKVSKGFILSLLLVSHCWHAVQSSRMWLQSGI